MHCIFNNGGKKMKCILASYLDLYDKDAWYANKWYWIFGGLCLIFPAFIMLIVFAIQINCKVAKALDVPGSNLYYSPYIWILLMIIPVVGWVLFIVMGIYISIWPIVSLYKGYGEKYIK